ncbi:MAG: hypothetical protein FWE36_06495 [Erysipelotrichales bacterium]|nr:hypothetical protein [Erysipelotrichales bacterium]
MVENPVNLVYNGYTTETNANLVYDPDELTWWRHYWRISFPAFWRTIGKAFGWWNDLHWGWKILIGVVVLLTLGLGAAFLPGADGVIFGAAFSTALSSAAIGTGIAAIGGIGAAIDDESIAASILNGAAGGFAIGAVTGGIYGAASSVIRIATGATNIYGSAQVNSATFFHRMASNMQAGKMVMSGQYSSIYLNSGLKTAGLKGGALRPDVIGIGRFGQNTLVEVTSTTQTAAQMAAKLQMMAGMNPGVNTVLINWVAIIGIILF